MAFLTLLLTHKILELKSFSNYTPQNKSRVTQWTFPYVVYCVSSVAQTRQAIEKQFSASLNGVKNKAFPVKNLAFKFFILSKIRHFCHFLKQNHKFSFLCMSILCVINGTQ